jgi:hypothetical protein
VQNLQKLSPDAQMKKLSIDNLKNFLLQYDFEKEVRIVCIDECSECRVILDKDEEKVLSGVLFNKAPQLYRYDPIAGYVNTQA